EDRQVERLMIAERAFCLVLEARHVVVDPHLLLHEPARRERELRVEALARHLAELAHELVAPRSAAEVDQGPRIEPWHLRRDAHELGEVQVEAAVDVSDEYDALRYRAAERAERLAEAGVAVGAGDRPSERRRDAGQRLADVRVAPHRARVSAFGEPQARDVT